MFPGFEQYLFAQHEYVMMDSQMAHLKRFPQIWSDLKTFKKIEWFYMILQCAEKVIEGLIHLMTWVYLWAHRAFSGFQDRKKYENSVQESIIRNYNSSTKMCPGSLEQDGVPKNAPATKYTHACV